MYGHSPNNKNISNYGVNLQNTRRSPILDNGFSFGAGLGLLLLRDMGKNGKQSQTSIVKFLAQKLFDLGLTQLI